jgi:hypothetical protein
MARNGGRKERRRKWANGNGEHPEDDTAQLSAQARNLQMVLDYAIGIGAELRLPVFVFIIRMALLELSRKVPGVEVAEGDPQLPASHAGEN